MIIDIEITSNDLDDAIKDWIKKRGTLDPTKWELENWVVEPELQIGNSDKVYINEGCILKITIQEKTENEN